MELNLSGRHDHQPTDKSENVCRKSFGRGEARKAERMVKLESSTEREAQKFKALIRLPDFN